MRKLSTDYREIEFSEQDTIQVLLEPGCRLRVFCKKHEATRISVKPMHRSRGLAVGRTPDNGSKRVVKNAPRVVNRDTRRLCNQDKLVVLEYRIEIRRNFRLLVVFHMIHDLVFVRCDDLLDEADGETVYFTATDSYERLLPVKNAVSAVPGASNAFYADTYTDEWYLEVFSDRASKANAVRKLREMYGFDRIVCFGDNLNDLPMFSVSDVRIAVGNARQETKDAADIIIAPNSENGIASWLRENFRASGLL